MVSSLGAQPQAVSCTPVVGHFGSFGCRATVCSQAEPAFGGDLPFLWLKQSIRKGYRYARGLSFSIVCLWNRNTQMLVCPYNNRLGKAQQHLCLLMLLCSCNQITYLLLPLLILTQHFSNLRPNPITQRTRNHCLLA